MNVPQRQTQKEKAAVSAFPMRSEIHMQYRTEHDSMGEIQVPADRLWGAQTQRSLENFPIGRGHEPMPEEIIQAFAVLKMAAARVNHRLRPERMTKEKLNAIEKAAEEILEGLHRDEFPLVVWQTGSGTQTNMNMNEVIANRGNQLAGRKLLHPNDDVNMSQSSNDTFPTAMHIAAVQIISRRVLPAVRNLAAVMADREQDFRDVLKCGRTHLQDAVPMRFSQEISGWRAGLERDAALLDSSLSFLSALALGGTAVGTGLNAPAGFDGEVAREISSLTGLSFQTDGNKFHALTSLDEMVFAHGALKALAMDMMKTANDVRWLASGPRTGLGEIILPENEPGSSIMPGKVNPTQCEQVTMVAVRVLGNDTSVSLAASQGNFELNVFLPVTAYSFLQSGRLLAESISSFTDRCFRGIQVNEARMKENLEKSLMTVTGLTPVIGYENAARIAQKAHAENLTLKEAAVSLGIMTKEEFERSFHPEKMV